MKLSFIVLVCLVGALTAAPTPEETKTPAVRLVDREQQIPVKVKNLSEADVKAEADALKPKKRESKAGDAPKANEVKKTEEKIGPEVKPAPAEEKPSGSTEKTADVAETKPAAPEKAVESKAAPTEVKTEEIKADAPQVVEKSAEEQKPEAKPVVESETKPAEAKTKDIKTPIVVAKSAEEAKPAAPVIGVEITAAPAAEEPKSAEPLKVVKIDAAPAAPVVEIEPKSDVATSPVKVTESTSESATEAITEQSTESEVQAKIEPIVAVGRSARVLSDTNEENPAKRTRSGKKYSDFQIVQLESEVEDGGKYRYQFESEDGISANQQGELKKIDDEHSGESVKGGYSYTDDEGKTFSLTYTADENGYRPVADYLPVGPTIPPAIARALAWAATAKPWVDPWVVEQEKLREARKGKEPVKRAARRA